MTATQMFKEFRNILERGNVNYQFECKSANQCWIVFHVCSRIELKDGELTYSGNKINSGNFAMYKEALKALAATAV